MNDLSKRVHFSSPAQNGQCSGVWHFSSHARHPGPSPDQETCWPRTCGRGFTLLEVLLALLLFTLSVVVLSAAYVGVLQAMDGVKLNHVLEMELSRARQMVQYERDRETVETGGLLESLQYGSMDWRAVVRETRVADLFHVRLELSWQEEQARERDSVFQEFYLLRPDWSDPGERERLRAEAAERLRQTQFLR